MQLLTKITKVGIALGLAAGIVGCSSTSSSSVTIPDTEDIQAIQDAGVLKVGVKKNVEGFSQKKDGEYVGLEVDLAKKLADDLGVEVEYTAVSPSTRQTLLENGDIDCVLATYTITKERKEIFDFSKAYYTGAVSVLVEDDTITSLSDLQNRAVGVASNSNSARDLVEAMIDAGLIDGSAYDEDTFDASTWTTGITFHVYDDYTSIDAALSAGDIDGFCTDTSILKGYTTSERHLIDETFAEQKYGIATQKGSGLSEFANDEVAKWKEEGSLAALIKSYDL